LQQSSRVPVEAVPFPHQPAVERRADPVEPIEQLAGAEQGKIAARRLGRRRFEQRRGIDPAGIRVETDRGTGGGNQVVGEWPHGGGHFKQGMAQAAAGEFVAGLVPQQARQPNARHLGSPGEAQEGQQGARLFPARKNVVP
jgi:hypothetical protein